MSHVADAMLRRALPAIRLHTIQTPEVRIGIGVTKLGGLPDMSPSDPWPTRDCGRPLVFLGQLKLSEMPTSEISDWPLPIAGRLLFFFDIPGWPCGYEPEDRDGFRVLWYPDESAPLERRPLPPYESGGLESPFMAYEPAKPCAVEATTAITFDEEDFYLNNRIERSEDEFDCLNYKLKPEAHGRQGRGAHRLLGHHDNVQWDPRFMSKLCSQGLRHPMEMACDDRTRGEELTKDLSDWRILMQFDSDDKVGWCWDDRGTLCFTISRESLARLDFSNVWANLQSF